MKKNKKEEIKRLIDKYLKRVISIRQHLHQHPELGHNEFETSKYIRKTLSELNLEILPPFLKTDTVAFLNREKTERNITLRADMDALPINETSTLPYKSLHKNIMHACGHDGHTAILLGTAMVLSELKEKINGSVRFVFQPAEETYAGGKDLVEKGAIDSPKADAIFAIHGAPTKPAGHIYARPGAMTAAGADIKITIKGKGAHGGRPEDSIDPILISSKIIDSLYHIPSRSFGALEPLVISICQIESGSACNIIPATATMGGTIRFLDMALEPKIKSHVKQVIKSVCDMYGATFEFEYKCDYPPVVNDKSLIDFSEEVLPNYLNKETIHLDANPIMGSEDFSYFLQKSPGIMFWMGLGEDIQSLHVPDFDFNDEIIKDGIRLFTALTLEYLG